MANIFLQSTEFLIDVMDSFVKSKIITKGMDNIPDNPTLYVVNHFTRLETLLIPYIIYKEKKTMVRSLGDHTLFEGLLAYYLKETGSVSTKDPHRNEIILGDLMTGKNSWIIYPEGNMVKNKLIIKEKYGYMIEHDNICEKIHTGSAVLALKSELLKDEFLQLKIKKDKDGMEEFCVNHFIEKVTHISSKPTVVVPVNVSYYPIRPGTNNILKIANSIVGNMSKRTLEEIEIEGNILLKSDIDISFGEPIDIEKYILDSGEYKNEILDHKKRELTTIFMDRVYSLITINFDHFFALTIYSIEHDYVSVEYLKKLIFINILYIKKLDLYKFHSRITKYASEIISSDHLEAFEDMVSMCIKADILTRREDVLHINKKRLLVKDNFHKIRLTNTIKIIYNDISIHKDLIDIAAVNSKKWFEQIDKEIFEKLYKEAQVEFDHDYKKHFKKGVSKPKEIGAPFLYESKRNDTVLIFAHGYKSAPAEIKDLALYLCENNICSVYGVRLKGHGTAPKNLRDVLYEEWISSFEDAVAMMKCRYKNIFIGGFSTGGLISLINAGMQKESVKGVISVNAALHLNDLRMQYIDTLSFIKDIIDVFKQNKKENDAIRHEAEYPNINYEEVYIKSLKQLSKLMKKCDKALHEVKIPSLIIQAKHDPVVNPKSGKIIYDRINSADKQLYEPDMNVHCILPGDRRHEVFEEVEKFIKAQLKKLH